MGSVLNRSKVPKSSMSMAVLSIKVGRVGSMNVLFVGWSFLSPLLSITVLSLFLMTYVMFVPTDQEITTMPNTPTSSLYLHVFRSKCPRNHTKKSVKQEVSPVLVGTELALTAGCVCRLAPAFKLKKQTSFKHNLADLPHLGGGGVARCI